MKESFLSQSQGSISGSGPGSGSGFKEESEENMVGD